MLKSVILLCVVFCVVIEARPKWQFLPAVPGYVPVYIRSGDTPLEEINPDLAEAFHVLPVGRSANKQIDASPEVPDQADQPREDQKSEQPIEDQTYVPKNDSPVQPDEISAVDRRPYEKKVQKKKATEITKPVERR